MILGYLACIVMSVVAAGLTWALGLLELTLWQAVAVYGAAFPLYLLTLIIYLSGVAYAFRVFPKVIKEDGEAATSDNGNAE